MPNRILLLFSPEPIEVPGMLASHTQKAKDEKSNQEGRNESMLDVARAVAKKAFWPEGVPNSKADKPPEDCDWHDYLEDTLKGKGLPTVPELDSHEAIHNAIARLPNTIENQSPDKRPCFAIIDMALYHYLREDENRQKRLGELKNLLEVLWDRDCCPIYLVSTIRAPQRDDDSLKYIRPYYHGSIQLLRSDSNIWDALYNLVKRGEHRVRLREVMAGERFEYDLTEDTNEDRCALKPKQGTLRIAPADLDKPLIIEDHILDVLVITPTNIADCEQLRDDVSTINNQACKQPIIIRNCEIGRLEFSGVCFEQPVIFDNTRITGKSRFRFCEFRSVLHFHSCRFDNDMDLELSTFTFRTPWFHKCHFLLRLMFRRNITPDAYAMRAAPTLMFSRTIFEANNRIDMPKQRARLIFYSCNFHSGEYTEVNWLRFRDDKTAPIRSEANQQEKGIDLEGAMFDPLDIELKKNDIDEWMKKLKFTNTVKIADNTNKQQTNDLRSEFINWISGMRRFRDRREIRENGKVATDLTPDLDIYVRMVNCDISGRIVFRENPHYTRFYDDKSEASVMGLILSLEGSAVNGTVDVSEVRIRWLDVLRTNFQSGGVVMNRMQRRPKQESMRLSSIIWDVIPVITVLLVLLTALSWNPEWISTHPISAVVGLFVVLCLLVGWYTYDWKRRIGWLVNELQETTNRQNTRWYDKCVDQLNGVPIIRRLLRGIRRIFRVRAEYSGLIQHELILDYEEYVRSEKEQEILEQRRERWRFGDAARIRTQLVEPQNTIVAQPHSKLDAHNEKTRRYYFQEVFSSIAQQYEDLTHAFANAPVTDELEDLCHYKALKYRNEANGMSVPLKTQGWVRFFTFIYALITVGFAFVAFKESGCFWDKSWYCAGIIWAFVTSIGICYCHNYWEYRTALMHLLKRLMLERILAYGVYPSRTFMSAGVLILLYAIFYTVLPVIPDAGYIVGGESQTFPAETKQVEFSGETKDNPKRNISGQYTIESKPSDGENAPGQQQGFPAMLYFSIVTFTTLGYGDMHPTGFLRIVAGSEALVGAIMIAMITVSLARQFLRR